MNTLSKTIIALAVVSSASAFAQPVMSTTCPTAAKLRLPPNSNGLYMSADCKTVYLLPPKEGTVILEAASALYPLDRCKEVDIVIKNLNALTKRVTSVDFLKEEKPETPVRSTGFDPYAPLPTGRPAPAEVPEPKLTEAEVIDLLTKKKALIDDMMKEYSRISGVAVQLNYSTGYGDLIKKTQELNPGITVAMMPLKNTRFGFSRSKVSSEYPAVINSGIPAFENDESDMNGSVSGNVELSLIGGCALRSPYTNRLPLVLHTFQYASMLTANLRYEYDLQSTAKYTVQLHRGMLAKKIREVSTKGGFFNSKSVSKLINTESTNSWFKYFKSCDESRMCGDDAAHNETIVQIKKRLLDEVLESILLVKMEYPLAPEAAATPGRTGAQTGSDELKKCENKYCQISAGVLDVAIASAGGNSKVDEYINTHTDWVEESSETRKAFPYKGSMGFAPKDL